jgi:choline dehydrogenase-like flavoprotein
MQSQSEVFDAIVVGSGISGGWAAKELTERGLRVLMLERGKDVEHVKDYVNARKAPWEYPHRGGRTRAMEEAYPVLKRDYPLNEKNLDWWVNEKDSPYTEIKRFDWYRGYHVGGRSLTWGRQSYRLSDLDFEANAKDGIAIDWPIRYATSRLGTITSSALLASPDRPKGCRSCQTGNFNQRCRSTARKR